MDASGEHSGQEGRAGQPVRPRPKRNPRRAKTNEFALHTLEKLARNYVGVHTRTMALWSGGVYCMVLLLSDNYERKHGAQLRARALWPRIQRFEALCNAGNLPVGVKGFESHFLWITSPVYREFLSLVARGHMAAAEQLSWRVFAGIYQEKGGQKERQDLHN